MFKIIATYINGDVECIIAKICAFDNDIKKLNYTLESGIDITSHNLITKLIVDGYLVFEEK